MIFDVGFMIFDVMFANAGFTTFYVKLVFTVALSPSLILPAAPSLFHLGIYPCNPVGCFIVEIWRTLLFLHVLAVSPVDTGR